MNNKKKIKTPSIYGEKQNSQFMLAVTACGSYSGASLILGSDLQFVPLGPSWVGQTPSCSYLCSYLCGLGDLLPIQRLGAFQI